MKLLAPIIALAGLASARFSGDLYIGVGAHGNHDGECVFAVVYPTDSVLYGLRDCSMVSCYASAGSEIANSHFVCQSDKGQVDIMTQPHDTLEYCRDGGCSCMATKRQENDYG
ncbi:hypothetical protein NLG97_g7532 [Lecanicillium saksenae]|uniref:Uncharacterized protein n=1 Tax=Lecanicillium saksenae TaxID=468837 RepID=A0ACC1QMN9_9HYPO|nr:hypothetical protein NLG97_g7532 [Lecanicillium saksenae]